MRDLADRGLLLLFCLFPLAILEEISWYPAALFIAVVCTGFCYFFENRLVTVCFLAAEIVLAFLRPEFCCFLPVAVYDAALVLPAGILLPSLLPLLSLERHLLPLAPYLLFGGSLAVYLKFQTLHWKKQEIEVRKNRDDSTERNLLLKEKNKTLREKQDYEIHNATLRERNRIAREIHDNVGHLLSRSILMVGALRAVNTQISLNSPLGQLEDSLTSAMESIRSSVHDLHDDSLSLQQASESLLKDFTFCPVAFTYDMSLEIPRDIKYCFLAITKEGLANIMKHSQATKASLTMREHPALYQLILKDNGQTAGPVQSNGIGLTNMQERVRALGGTVSIQKNNGFSIFIAIPKNLENVYKEREKL